MKRVIHTGAAKNISQISLHCTGAHSRRTVLRAAVAVAAFGITSVRGFQADPQLWPNAGVAAE